LLPKQKPPLSRRRNLPLGKIEISIMLLKANFASTPDRSIILAKPLALKAPEASQLIAYNRMVAGRATSIGVRSTGDASRLIRMMADGCKGRYVDWY
jgi:hypothetical protein